MDSFIVVGVIRAKLVESTFNRAWRGGGTPPMHSAVPYGASCSIVGSLTFAARITPAPVAFIRRVFVGLVPHELLYDLPVKQEGGKSERDVREAGGTANLSVIFVLSYK